MLQRSTRRLLPALSHRVGATRAYSVPTDNPLPANDPSPKTPNSPVSNTNNLPVSSEGSMDAALQESFEEGEKARTMQAPNRAGIWSKSQKPRSEAMVGPRFEQTIMKDQPLPFSAMELIHQQPVRWTSEKVVSCDGGGGPLGHPRIFINTDKPQINWCTYCGLPFANNHHRKHLESLPSTPFPLEPTGHAAEIPSSQITGKTGSTEAYQSNTGKPLEQR